MDKKTEGKILDIAAELLVSPLAFYAKACEIRESITESETYEKTKEAVKSAGGDVKAAAKKVYESEPVRRGRDTVKSAARKVSESEAYTRTKDAVVQGTGKIKEGIDTVASKLGFGSAEEGSSCCGTPAEAEEGCCCKAESEETSSCCEPSAEAEEGCCCEAESEEGSSCCDTPAEAEEGCCCEAEKEESIEDVIDEVDLSGIITEEDANKDIPES